MNMSDDFVIYLIELRVSESVIICGINMGGRSAVPPDAQTLPLNSDHRCSGFNRLHSSCGAAVKSTLGPPVGLATTPFLSTPR